MKKDIARGLIGIGAVKFSPNKPFLYASGLSGPIYCDNRLILSDLNLREKVIAGFLEIIKKNNLSYDLLCGIATAGIPHAAFIADRLKKPMVYVRPKAKDHGKKNQVEGAYRAHEQVLLFEDLVNQGASLMDAMTGLNEAQLTCRDCLCVVDYQMPEAADRLKKLSLNLWSLTDFSSLISSASELNLIDDEGLQLLKKWHSDPKKWSDAFKA